MKTLVTVPQLSHARGADSYTWLEYVVPCSGSGWRSPEYARPRPFEWYQRGSMRQYFLPKFEFGQ